MEMLVNGEMKHVAGETLNVVLDELGYSGKRFLVELNGEIISKDLYTSTRITAADRLEIVSFVGGG